MSRFLKRAARARVLAERYPGAAESLLFVAKISEWQEKGEDPEELCALVRRIGPEPLRLASRDVNEAQIEAYFASPDADKPESFFARVILETRGVTRAGDAANECPRCGHPPQLGVLRAQGDGAALYLGCSLCRNEWVFHRSVCPGCGESSQEKILFGKTDDFPAVLTQTCDSCWTYLHLIDMSKDPQAVPEADELAAQPLDVWAIEQGYEKIFPNWIGL
ncbi:MAG TPA: formate dehydrogenase accessory protein FdhE [Bryobacteraceae bacterium]|nr:formate dehydrogenase accessory protein FdhE [Bryobacteraceae bacterium]